MPVTETTDKSAPRIDWTPLRSSATNFVTHNLVPVGPERYELRPSRTTKWFSGALFAIAAVVLFTILDTILPVLLSRGEWLHAAMSLVSPSVLLFFAITHSLKLNTTTVFDRAEGAWWRQRGPTRLQNAPLRDLHALQLLGTTAGRGHRTRELNLVLRDGSRCPILEHSRNQMHRDAAVLAAWLGVPVLHQ